MMTKRTKYGIYLAMLSLAAVWGAFSSLYRSGSCRTDFTFRTMGTIARFSFTGTSSRQAERAAMLAKQEFDRVIQIADLHRSESELSRLNRSAFQQEFFCSDEMWQMLQEARFACRFSGGAFDITVKPLMDLWGFYRKRGKAPSPEEIREVLKQTGFDKLHFDDRRKSIRFRSSGMALDLGGIAKGFALDRARERLRQEGVTGILDLGGNLAFLPGKPAGKARVYRVAVKDPGNPRRLAGGVLEVAPGMAVSTSGDYERLVEYNGRRYGHIIDPVSGEPAAPECSATVVFPSAMRADWLSTAVFLRGAALAEKAEKELKNCRVWMVKK